jgi:xanthine dehydrogenase YagS FAD-binding subunit
MRDFAYARATDVASTVSALDDGAAIIAGGTELLNWFRLGIADDDRVIDIHDLSELYGISRQGDELRIGALATLNEVGEHSLVNDGAAALGSACRQAASAQLRNRATLGGNILQRTRCRYFRARFRGAVTNAPPEAAAPHWPGGTSARPSSGGPSSVWRCIHPTRQLRSPR